MIWSGAKRDGRCLELAGVGGGSGFCSPRPRDRGAERLRERISNGSFLFPMATNQLEPSPSTAYYGNFAADPVDLDPVRYLSFSDGEKEKYQPHCGRSSQLDA